MVSNYCIHSISIDPPAGVWCDLAVDSVSARSGEMIFGRPVGEWVELSRSEIAGGLEGVEYVIGTGHQAGFWHCGILAKYIAADGAAVAMSLCNADGNAGKCGVLELVVDQDVNDPFRVRAPKRKKKLDVVGVRFAGINGDKSNGRVPVENRPPVVVDNKLSGYINGKFEPSSAREGLRAIAGAVTEAGGCRNEAEQAAKANYHLRGEMLGVADIERAMVFASYLTKVSIWDKLIALMRDEPRKCALCYNDAVMKYPDSRMVLLGADGGEIELPLWKIDDATGERQRVFARDLQDENVALRPRALLMTGLVRLVLVDLFIHGAGGKNYDRVTEDWFSHWLGVSLSPIAMVSADVYLDFGVDLVDEGAVSRARWELHHLRYNIDRVVEGGEELSARKQALVERIKELPRRSAERYAVYLELQSINEALRRQYGGILHEAREEIGKRERALADRAVIGDRTWAFPLHGRDTLRALRDEITRLFVKVEVPCGCGALGTLGD